MHRYFTVYVFYLRGTRLHFPDNMVVTLDNIQNRNRRDVLHDRFHAHDLSMTMPIDLYNLIYVGRNIINNRLLVIQHLSPPAVLSFDYRVLTY